MRTLMTAGKRRGLDAVRRPIAAESRKPKHRMLIVCWLYERAQVEGWSRRRRRRLSWPRSNERFHCQHNKINFEVHSLQADGKRASERTSERTNKQANKQTIDKLSSGDLELKALAHNWLIQLKVGETSFTRRAAERNNL